MVAKAGADPGHAAFAGFFNRQVHRMRHHQVPHAVVAIHHGHGGALMHHFDDGVFVDAAGLYALDVHGQADHAVAVRALHVGLGHQSGDLAGVGLRQALAAQRSFNKISKRLKTQDGGIGLGVQDEKPFKRAGGIGIEKMINMRVNSLIKVKWLTLKNACCLVQC